LGVAAPTRVVGVAQVEQCGQGAAIVAGGFEGQGFFGHGPGARLVQRMACGSRHGIGGCHGTQTGFRLPYAEKGFHRISANGRIPPASLTELRQPGRRPFSKAVPSETEVLSVKNCKLCSYSKLCNDLPGVCMLIPYVAVAVVTVAIGYLFITQELM
jgi:hypothetical protein